MKKTVKFLALLLGCLLVFAACSEGADVSGSTNGASTSDGTTVSGKKDDDGVVKIAYMLPNVGEWYDEKWASAKKCAEEEYGAEITMFSAGGYANISTQVSQVEDVIQAGYDAIIIHLCNAAGLQPVLVEAMEAGIVVVTEHSILEDPTLAPHVWENPSENGTVLALLLANEIGGKGKVLMLNGPAGQLESAAAEAGFTYIMETYFPEIQVTKEWPNHSVADTLPVVESYLSANPDIAGIYSFGTGQTGEAAIQALKAYNYQPGDVKIVSCNSVASHFDYLKQGWYQYLSPSSNIYVPRTSLSVVYKMLAGEPVENEYNISMTVVNATTCDVFDRSGFVWKD